MIFLDLETTGFDPKECKIIEFAAVRTDENLNVIDTLDFLVNPETEIPLVVTQITNIFDKDVEDQEPFEVSIEKVKKFIGDDVIIGHNITFDTGFLKEYGIAENNPVLDTNELATLCLPTQESYALEVLSDMYGIEHKYKHRALGDVIASVDLMKICLDELSLFPEEFFEKMQSFKGKIIGDIVKVLLSVKKKSSDNVENKICLNKESSVEVSKNASLYNQVELNSESGKSSFLQVHSLQEAESYMLQFLQDGGGVLVNSKYLAFFQQKFSHCLDNTSFIAMPEKRASKKALEVFLAKDSYDEKESLVLLKILRNKAQEKAMTEFDLNIHWGDYPIWNQQLQSSIEEEKGSIQEQVDEAHSFVMANDLVLKNDIQTGEKPVLFFDIREDGLDRIFHGVFAHKWINQRVKTDELKNEFQSFFDQCKEMAVGAETEFGNYGKQVELKEIHISSELFQKLQKESEALILQMQSISSLKKSVDVLKEFFNPSVKSVRFIFVNKRGEVTLNVVPLSHADVLKDLPLQSVFLGVSQSVGEDRGFFERTIGRTCEKIDLDGTKSEKKSIKVHIPDANFPSPKNDDFFNKVTGSLRSLTETTDESIVVFVSNKNMIEKLYLHFIEHPLDERKVLAGGFTGGKHKTLHVLRNNPKNIFFCQEDFIEFLAIHNYSFSNGVILQFPFDPPNQALIQARGKWHAEKINNSEFGAYALPKSVLRTQQVVHLMNVSDLYILDARVKNKWAEDYQKIV